MLYAICLEDSTVEEADSLLRGNCCFAEFPDLTKSASAAVGEIERAFIGTNRFRMAARFRVISVSEVRLR